MANPIFKKRSNPEGGDDALQRQNGKWQSLMTIADVVAVTQLVLKSWRSMVSH